MNARLAKLAIQMLLLALIAFGIALVLYSTVQADLLYDEKTNTWHGNTVDLKDSQVGDILVYTGAGTWKFMSPALPRPDITPGVVRGGATLSYICNTKWGLDHRAVTAKMKKEVFASYGFVNGNKDPRCPCEIDHLVSRELGGADVVANLWPQPYNGAWNAHMKDKLENRLHKEMCAGHITLEQAQSAIKNDWRIAYRQYYGEPK